jgi:hypothetical protein
MCDLIYIYNIWSETRLRLVYALVYPLYKGTYYQNKVE